MTASPLDPRAAAELGERLLRADRSRRALLIRNSHLTRRVEVVHWLLDRSLEERFRSVARMSEVAREAVGLAEALPDDLPADVLYDARARAWLCLANVHRIAGAAERAGEAFGRASELGRRTSGAARFLAELAMVRAPLLRLSGQSDRALDDCLASHRELDSLGETHLAGRALVCAATVHYTEGDHRRSIELSAAGLRQVDAAREPTLIVTASHNIAASLIESGHAAEGLETLRTIEPAYTELGLERPALKVRFLEAKALLALGRRREAHRRLDETRSAALVAGRTSLAEKILELRRDAGQPRLHPVG